VESRVLKGMGLQQVINASEQIFNTLNLKAFLFEKIPSIVFDKDWAFQKLIAKLN